MIWESPDCEGQKGVLCGPTTPPLCQEDGPMRYKLAIEMGRKAALFRYLVIAFALLRISIGQRVPRLGVTRIAGTVNRIELVCRYGPGPSSPLLEGAFVFRDPKTGSIEKNVSIPEGGIYVFTIHQSNESVISCRGDSLESLRVDVAAAPPHIAATAISQYFYPDSDEVEIVCPFSLGRLESLYLFSWEGTDSNGRSGSITNGTLGVYWLAEERKRILHVNLTASPLRHFECVVRVLLYTTTSMSSTQETRSPRINLTPPVPCSPNPTPPLHGLLEPSARDTTNRNSTLMFKCKRGFEPQKPVIASCLANGTWSPAPAAHICTDVDECNISDINCPQSTECINTIGSYTCPCDVGYLYSEDVNSCIDVDECTFGSHDCNESVGATCTNTEGSFTCVYQDRSSCNFCEQLCASSVQGGIECTCDSGYYLACDRVSCIDVNECLIPNFDGCVHARCANTVGSYTCVCADGFVTDGENNCTDINECLNVTSNICDINADCVNTYGSFTCVCHSSYYGDGISCSKGIGPVIDEYRTLPARPNHNLLYDVGANFCLEEPMNTTFYSSIVCRLARRPVPLPEFQWRITLNESVLTSDEISAYIDSTIYDNDTLVFSGNMIAEFDQYSVLNITCDARNTFGNDIGITSISVCSPLQCQDGVTNNCTQNCVRNIATGKHECSCQPGFEFEVGSDSICQDIDECSIGQHNCSAAKQLECNNTIGSVECVCMRGFSGDNCDDINECVLEMYECPLSSICENLCGSYECVCVNSTRKDSQGNCSDINECLEGFHTCSENARCEKVVGGYTCDCHAGFEGNGNICTDINECKLGMYECPLSSICENLYGSYACVCVNRTRKDSQGNCSEIDECLEGTHNCSENARCEKVAGGYTCVCGTGLEWNGNTCTVSREIIISTSIIAAIIVAATLLVSIVLGGIKLRRYVNEVVTANKLQKNLSKRKDSVLLDGKANTMMESLNLKVQLPPALTISYANLRVLDPVGQGEFSIVYKGYLAGQQTGELVAIKTLKGFIDTYAVQDLLKECARMKDFDDLHVITLKGVCLDGGPKPYIILPFMANGSLLSYLRKHRLDLVLKKDANSEDEENSQVVSFTRKRLLDMCLQVAKGMEYLSSNKVVHRDLAARNCMIDFNMVIKVADFGLAVNIGAKEYYRLTKHANVKLPLMWMAPESLSDYMFSELSDVWSYGVTCWEIFTGGKAPYAGIKPSSLLPLLQEGGRLEIPNNTACSQEMYSVMQQCWELEAGKRPPFSVLVKTLSNSLEEMADYLHIGAFTIDLHSSTGEDEHKL